MATATPNGSTTSVEPIIVTATDGTPLAVYQTPSARRDALGTIVAVHGYPDDHTVWDAVTAELSQDFRIIRYDVRGSGRSGRPSAVSAYKIPQLVSDFVSVIDAAAPGEQVHVLAHDWGSIQCWDVVTAAHLRPRLASFTSISGPSLDMAGAWLRQLGSQPKAKLAQMLDSYYIFLFQLPFLPELAARRGVIGKLVSYSSAAGRPAGSAVHVPARGDAELGVQLYRANMMQRFLRPRPQETTVPTQVLAPTDDLHVTVPLQTQAPVDFATDLRTQEIPGNHWVVTQNAPLIAGLVKTFINDVTQEN